MIHILVPHELLILLRAVLLLGPIALTFYFGWRCRSENRLIIGGLFSFLYGFALLLPAHMLAMYAGLWKYGDNALMFMNMPADIWLAGAMLFGPAIFFALPNLNPWVLTLGCIALQALTLPSLAPFVIVGGKWFIGVVLVFVTVHIPALFLARWTARNDCLPERAGLLAFGFGLTIYFVLPSIIMYAMGGSWHIESASWVSTLLTLLALAPCVVIGLSAVQMFVLHGEGTPIPLDKTRYLVRSGLYGYIANPMQCATVLSWIILGVFLQNIFIVLAAAMAVVFVFGMVRWHHRVDLCVRFPDGWPEYREHVPDWVPQWRPWVKYQSTLRFDHRSRLHNTFVTYLCQLKTVGLDFKQSEQQNMIYTDGNRGVTFSGVSAMACALFHGNFATALAGSALMLIVLPAKWAADKALSFVGMRHA